MSIKAGDNFPAGELLRVGENGPESVNTSEITAGRVAIFGLPGAYTGVCTTAHMPSFIRSADQFRAKGIDRIVCLTVNDPFVCEAWAKSTGAPDAGIEVLADSDGSVTKALGLNFDAPPAGLYGRCKRFSALLNDGKVEVLNIEDNPGQCTVSAGEALLEKA